MGTIEISANVVKASGGDATLTLKANKAIRLLSSGVSSTSGKLNVVMWSDSDGVNGGQVIVCALASSYCLDTNGGHVAIGGGSTSTTWRDLTIPAGYSQANTAFGTSWWGVELGVNQDIANSKLIRTGGGHLRIYGDTNSAQSALYGIAWESGEINTGAGSIELSGRTNRDTSATGGLNYGVGIGANRGNSNDCLLYTSPSPRD